MWNFQTLNLVLCAGFVNSLENLTIIRRFSEFLILPPDDFLS